MFKNLRSEKGEAVLIFLLGLVFTMTVSAIEISDLRAEAKECKAPQEVSFNLIK